MKKYLLWGLRVLLAVLILANMAVIYRFSAQSAEESANVSIQVGNAVADKFHEDLSGKTQSELEQFWVLIRKSAHILEFGSLGGLVYLFLLTFRGNVYVQYLVSLGFTLLYAVSDEIHQVFVESRSGSVRDVLVDMLGAFIACSIILWIAFGVRRRRIRASAGRFGN